MRRLEALYGSHYQYMLNAANSGNCCNFRGRPGGRVPSWSTGWVAVTSSLFRGADLLA